MTNFIFRIFFILPQIVPFLLKCNKSSLTASVSVQSLFSNTRKAQVLTPYTSFCTSLLQKRTGKRLKKENCKLHSNNAWQKLKVRKLKWYIGGSHYLYVDEKLSGKNVRAWVSMDFTQNKFSAPIAIEKIKILGAPWEPLGSPLGAPWEPLGSPLGAPWEPLGSY